MTMVSHMADVTMRGGPRGGGGGGKYIAPMVTAWSPLTPAIDVHRACNIMTAGCMLAVTAAVTPYYQHRIPSW